MHGEKVMRRWLQASVLVFWLAATPLLSGCTALVPKAYADIRRVGPPSRIADWAIKQQTVYAIDGSFFVLIDKIGLNNSVDAAMGAYQKILRALLEDDLVIPDHVPGPGQPWVPDTIDGDPHSSERHRFLIVNALRGLNTAHTDFDAPEEKARLATLYDSLQPDPATRPQLHAIWREYRPEAR